MAQPMSHAIPIDGASSLQCALQMSLHASVIAVALLSTLRMGVVAHGPLLSMTQRFI